MPADVSTGMSSEHGHTAPSCLWFAADVPFPAENGLFAYSAGLSSALAGAGSSVVAFGLGTGSGRSGGPDWHAVAGKRRSRLATLASPLPAMAARVATTAYRHRVSGELDRATADVVVVDHLQMAWALRLLRRQARPRPLVVYVAHNHEVSVRRDLAASVPLRSIDGLALRLDACKVTRLERRALRDSDLLVALTDHDARRFTATRPAARVVVIPPGYAGDVVADRRIDGSLPRRAVVLGSLAWNAKQRNLLELLEIADPIFARRHAELDVIGDVPASLRRRLDGRLSATRLIGRVDDVSVPLRQARLAIVSEPRGGGFKLKALDYVFHRVPIAALTGSIAGLPLRAGREIIEFDTIADLAAGAADALDRPADLDGLQRRAWDACAGRFDWPDRGEVLLRSIRQAEAARGNGPACAS